MKLRSIIVWSVITLSACGVHIKPSPGPTPGPTPPPPPPPAYTERTNVLHVRDGAKALSGCAVAYALPLSDLAPKTTTDTGDASWLVRIPFPDSGGGRNAKVTIDCPGYESLVDSFVIAETGNQDIWFGGTYSAGNQPMLRKGPQQNAPWLTVTPEQLNAWRGSISTAIAPMPCGPRPSAGNNVMFTAEYGSSCWDASAKSLARSVFGAKGWTHWPIGPVESHGYSGTYPNQDWTSNPDGFADLLEQLWRDGKIPVVFLLPDTGFCADGYTIDHDCVEQRLTPIYSSPRFQALVKIAVLAWEPEYASADFIWGSQWMARVFPNAVIRAIHLPGDHSAPCKGSELVEGGGTIKDEGECWRPVAPFITTYLQQETWQFAGKADAGRTPLQQFLYDLWDSSHRFAEGSWPKRPDGTPIKVVAFEYASYTVTHDPSRAAEADQWGNAAVSIAPFVDPGTGRTIDPAKFITGYGDGGTVDVAPKRFTFSLTPSSTSAPRYTFTIHPKG